MKSSKLLFIVFILMCSSLSSQNLLERLEKEFPKQNNYAIGTFKTTRISIGHSVETRRQGQLEISIFTRFWDVPNSNSQSFLADKKTHRFSLEYGIIDRLTLGLGYTDFDGIYDGFLKYKLLRQSTGKSKTPISVTLFQSYTYRSNNIITTCLLYTSPSPRDKRQSRMPSSA